MTTGTPTAPKQDASHALPLLEMVVRAQHLSEAGDAAGAIALYCGWLAHNSGPLSYAAHYNLGAMYCGVGEWANAERAFRSAIAIHPVFLASHQALSGMLVQLGRAEEAMAHWYAQLLVFASTEPVGEAAVQALQALLSVPTIFQGNRSLAINPLDDTPELQQRMAQQLADASAGVYWHKMAKKTRYHHHGLRIGVSAPSLDALPIGLRKLLELYDETRLDITVFTWSLTGEDAYAAIAGRPGVHHLDISGLSDDQAACAVREREIDILVDCSGLSLNGRPHILRYQSAPLQLVWPTIAGVTTLPEVDFLLLDRHCTPPHPRRATSELPLLVPHSLQLLPAKQIAQERHHPSTVLAFAGDPLRITSQMRDIWLDTLSDLPGTVLRLAGLSPELQAHWQTLANDRSVAPEALQFFDLHHPTSLPEALMDADLFLDTFPMGSPEVAGCALACGIPVVTARGASMASRMTSGMLSIAGLEELVAQDLNTYAALLKSLVQHRDRQHALQRRVRSIPESHPLFDAHQWVYNLQKVFEGVHATLPPAPPQASYSAQTLAYLRPLASESALGPRTDAGRRYVIAAPPYQHNSAGIRVLYDLQRWLVCAGLDAIVCTWFQGYPVEQFVDDIVIYPEVAPGNLLHAKRVVRYILNTPGKLGHGEKHYGADEVLVAYNRHLAPYADGRVLQVPSIEPFFHARGRTGGVNAFYVGKGKNLDAHPEGCIEITKAFPATRSAMANFLRTVDTLYTYDDFTMLAPEAQRCGCRVLLIQRDSTVGECPMEPFPSEEEFRVQLHEFIELTRRL